MTHATSAGFIGTVGIAADHEVADDGCSAIIGRAGRVTLSGGGGRAIEPLTRAAGVGRDITALVAARLAAIRAGFAAHGRRPYGSPAAGSGSVTAAKSRRIVASLGSM